MITDVAITFDIEFDINGAFSTPDTRQPLGRQGLICNVNGRDIGLGAILDCLAAHDVRATFFVEALQSVWFGLSEMGDVAAQIQERGHEVQLHVHPVWLLFEQDDWQARARRDPPMTARHDALAALPPDNARRALQKALDVFAAWKLPAPEAIRTGNLLVETTLYPLFYELGLRVSSSVGMGLNRPQGEALHLFSGPATIAGVTEIPVTSFAGADALMRRQVRLATLIGLGRREQRALLNLSHDRELPFLVLLSHVSEFFGYGSDGSGRENRLTHSKLEQLCATIGASTGLRAATISEIAERLQREGARNDALMEIPRVASAFRHAEKALNWGTGKWS